MFDVMKCYHTWLLIIHVHAAIAVLCDYLILIISRLKYSDNFEDSSL